MAFVQEPVRQSISSHSRDPGVLAFIASTFRDDGRSFIYLCAEETYTEPRQIIRVMNIRTPMSAPVTEWIFCTSISTHELCVVLCPYHRQVETAPRAPLTSSATHPAAGSRHTCSAARPNNHHVHLCTCSARRLHSSG